MLGIERLLFFLVTVMADLINSLDSSAEHEQYSQSYQVSAASSSTTQCQLEESALSKLHLHLDKIPIKCLNLAFLFLTKISPDLSSYVFFDAQELTSC